MSAARESEEDSKPDPLDAFRQFLALPACALSDRIGSRSALTLIHGEEFAAYAS